jgi:hypothetical protein
MLGKNCGWAITIVIWRKRIQPAGQRDEQDTQSDYDRKNRLVFLMIFSLAWSA